MYNVETWPCMTVTFADFQFLDEYAGVQMVISIFVAENAESSYVYIYEIT